MSAVTIAVTMIGNDLTGGAFSGMIANAGRLNSVMGGLGAALNDMSPALALAGATAVVAGVAFKGFEEAISYGVRSAAELEYALVSLENALQADADMSGLLGDAVNDMAIRTVFSTTEATDAFTRLVEMGFTAQQVLYGFDPAAKALMDGTYHAKEALEGLGNQSLIMAQAMRTDAVTGANLLGAAMNIFSNEGLSAEKTADLLTGAFLNGVPSAEALTQALNMAGAGAATAGVHMDDFLVTLDLLTRNGMSASSAGASLNYMLQSLTAPTHKQKDELEALNLVVLGGADGYQILSSKLFDAAGNFVGLKRAVELIDQATIGKTAQEKMEIFAELFNVRSGRAAKVLANIKDFDGQYDAIMQRFAGTDVSKMADKQLHTLLGSFDAFKDTFKSMMANLFKPIEKPVTDAILKLNDLVGAVQKLPENMKTGIAAFLIIGGVATAVTLAVAGLAFIIGILGSVTVAGAPLWAFLGGAIAIVAGVIAGATGAFLAARATIDLLKPHVKEIGDFFQRVGDALRIFLAPWIAVVSGAFDKLGQVGKIIGPWLKTLSDFFRDVLHPILDMIATRLKESLIPAWDHLRDALGKLWTALQPAMPLFKAIGEFLGFVLLGLLGMVISGIVGVISGIATFLSGVVGFIAGVATIFIGIFEVAVGIVTTVFKVIEALATGHIDQVWGILRDGWNMIWQGIQDIVSGLWTAVLGLFNMTIGMIIAVIVGFYYSVVGWFQGLFDTLVGHSIIPDMVNAIVSWIAQLPGRVGAILGNLVSVAVSKAIEFKDGLVNKAAEIVGGLRDKATSAVNAARDALAGLAGIGSNAAKGLIDNLVGGLRAGIGRVAGVVGDIAGKIAGLLHHSVPEEGPLADDDQWGADFITNLTTGMHSRMDTLRSAANLAALTMTNPFITPRSSSAVSVPAPQSSGTVVVPVYLDGRQIAQYTLDLMDRKVAQSGGGRYAR